MKKDEVIRLGHRPRSSDLFRPSAPATRARADATPRPLLSHHIHPKHRDERQRALPRREPLNMTEPSPKRRRTSAEPPPEVSAAGDFRPRNVLRRTPPRRASWLSPTKASLARFNPEILSRRASAVSATGSSSAQVSPTNRGQRARAYVLGESQQQPDAVPTAEDGGQRRQSIGGRKLPSMDVLHGAGADADRPEIDPAAPDGGQRRLSLGGRMLPSRDVLQAAAADQMAQETTQTERNPAVEDDLPMHPTGSPTARPDLPPQEGLFSSPSKRPRRNKSLGHRLSSPFKPRESPLRLEPPTSNPDADAEEPNKNQRAQVRQSPQVAGVNDTERRQARIVPTKVEVDPRQQEKEHLQYRLRELQEEVKQYEQEVRRSRNAPEDGEDNSALISLVNKANPVPPVEQPGALPLSSLLSAFLPLAKLVNPLTPPPDEPGKPLPSHEPVELDDPLPHLQLFTSFNYESKVDVGKDSGLQVHSISMRSPASLLRLDFEMTANPATQSVSNLDIQFLSPWASSELGSWITQRAAGNDVGAVCWAAESYYDLTVKRAKCWAQCYREFGRLLNDSTTAKTTKNGKKAGQHRGNQQTVPTSSNIEEEAEEVSGIGNDLAGKEQDGYSMSRAELVRGLGRQSIIFQSKEVFFKVFWNIQFDWTGEAESVVGADVALPGVCKCPWKHVLMNGC